MPSGARTASSTGQALHHPSLVVLALAPGSTAFSPGPNSSPPVLATVLSDPGCYLTESPGDATDTSKSWRIRALGTFLSLPSRHPLARTSTSVLPGDVTGLGACKATESGSLQDFEAGRGGLLSGLTSERCVQRGQGKTQREVSRYLRVPAASRVEINTQPLINNVTKLVTLLVNIVFIK